MASSSEEADTIEQTNIEREGQITRVRQRGGLFRVWNFFGRFFSGGKPCSKRKPQVEYLTYSSSSGELLTVSGSPPRTTPESLEFKTSKKSSKHRCRFCKRTQRLQCHENEEDDDRRAVRLDEEKKRVILINEKQKQKFRTNRTTTAKYTLLTFFPLFLFEQFRRYSNIFFLFIGMLQQIPGVSPTGRYVTLVPLLFIFSVSAIKEIVEDLRRHRDDKTTNSRKVQRLDAQLSQFVSIEWKDVGVGDIVRIENNQFFPADLILLSSSRPHALCFIETANLDGETSLKVRQGIRVTSEIADVKDLKALRGFIECELPNRQLYEFLGVLNIKKESSAVLGPDQILQRGAVLRNTAFIYGIVIYTGHDTKLMKNFAKAPLKNSSVDRVVNIQIVMLFVIFLTISLTSAFMSYDWAMKNNEKHSYLGLPAEVESTVIAFNIMTFLILLNNLIPISLQVTLEMVRVTQAYYINNDIEMYYPETDTPAKARTSNLNEELGMVKYVLSDKTGTLTRNIMELKKCSVAGRVYKVPKSEEEDTTIIRHLRSGEPKAKLIREFLIALSLCHTVIPEVIDDGHTIYHATSPDDRAIVEGLKNLGFVFVERTLTAIEVECLGERQRYELLHVSEFSSDRKRMSIVVRTPEGEIKVFCKGADMVILGRLSEIRDEFYELAMQHLNEFASGGLRTLCCAVRTITEAEYQDWLKNFEMVLKNTTKNREAELENVRAMIEENFSLLGVTAIEDKLQLGVPETIQALLEAGISLWVLTGDKQETAINVSYSCHLISSRMFLIILNETTLESTINAVERHLFDLRKYNNLALIIDGVTLNFALNCLVYKRFVELCLKCRVVICCRVSPMQKAEMTALVVDTGACTLAIGDGANDVAMIRTANVGVGISGVEGLQAASAADYSIAQFRYLKRLLLVHGAWNYRRITMCILYSFYKNICMSLIQWWFCLYSGWSGQIIFERWTIGSYNMLFTSMPCFVMGVFDRVCDAPIMLRYPSIYRRGQDGTIFNVRVFWIWVINAFIHSLILFFVPLIVYTQSSSVWTHGKVNDMFALGTVIFTYVVVTVSLKIGLMSHSWIWLTHLSIWGSIALWFLYLLIYSFFWPSLIIGYEFQNMYYFLFTMPVFWFGLLLLPCATNLIDFYAKVSYNTYATTVTQAVREVECRTKHSEQTL